MSTGEGGVVVVVVVGWWDLEKAVLTPSLTRPAFEIQIIVNESPMQWFILMRKR